MNTDTNMERNGYVDFLRALGLLLLIGVHVNAPEWYKPLRSFDVPLMVFISALCYKPLRGGYFTYAVKRFKRIYTPVFIFLTLFFIGIFTAHYTIGLQTYSISQVIGSYVLLNSPSIGYVWIMRVFLLMALVIPLVEKLLRNSSFIITIFTVVGILILQHSLIYYIDFINNIQESFILKEIILYTTGYLPLAIFGLKIQKFNRKQLGCSIILFGLIILVYMASNNWTFLPNKLKYPPRDLYIVYGLFASVCLWSIKDYLSPYISRWIFKYLSKNSMWIYLWHIIPVYILSRINWSSNTWFLRYTIVVISAIILYFLYSKAVNIFPDKIKKILQ